MRTAVYNRRAAARIRRAEQKADAAIQRAITQVLATLRRELTEYRIHRARTPRHRKPNGGPLGKTESV